MAANLIRATTGPLGQHEAKVDGGMHIFVPNVSKGESWQGLLLAAHPALKDPNFRRSVLFLDSHEPDQGAAGYVLNRPLGKSAAELLPEQDSTGVLGAIPVYLGGPVAHDQLSFARVALDASETEDRFRGNLTIEEVESLSADTPGCVRAFVGYAGWSAGQLEGEIEQKAWVLVKPGGADAPQQPGRVWYRIMSALGPTYKMLAALPDDISLN